MAATGYEHVAHRKRDVVIVLRIADSSRNRALPDHGNVTGQAVVILRHVEARDLGLAEVLAYRGFLSLNVGPQDVQAAKSLRVILIAIARLGFLCLLVPSLHSRFSRVDLGQPEGGIRGLDFTLRLGFVSHATLRLFFWRALMRSCCALMIRSWSVGCAGALISRYAMDI